MYFLRLVNRLLWTLIITVALLGFLAFLAFMGWREFGPRKPVPNAHRRQIAELVLPVIVEDLRRFETNYPSLTVLHLANDPTDYVTDRLRTLLAESGAVSLSEPSLEEKLQRALQLPVRSADSLEAALMHARKDGAAAVLFGRVEQFQGTSDAAEMKVELLLADVAERSVVFQQTYQRDWKPTPLEPVVFSEPDGRGRLASRLVFWTLLVLLLPVFTIQFLRATVRRSSNHANAGVLGLYTAAAALLAWLVLGIRPETSGSWIVLGALTGAAFLYHVWIMTVALRLEEA